MNSSSTIAQRAQRTLQIVFFAFTLIAFRITYLATVEREDKLKEADKPMHRSILLRADRGEIYDRFHIPLAINKICYNAAIYYGQLSQIPNRSYSIDSLGNREPYSPRKEHVHNLSLTLSKILDMPSDRIEDLIYSKASLFPHVPYILKSNLNEKQYFQLKLIEKDWIALHAEISSERYYPLKKVGCHLIGTLGSISQRQYLSIAEEIFTLEDAILNYDPLDPFMEFPSGYQNIDEIYQRLQVLKDKSYTLNDKVGISGIEKQFEEELRGLWGSQKLEINNQGTAIKKCEIKEPISGNQIVLSISAELQQFAEELLIANEALLEGKSLAIDPIDKMKKPQKQPWIKGGAIVAIDPKTGEILALASHPRFDPNDFIIKKDHKPSSRWLENGQVIGEYWDGQIPLMRERPIDLKKKHFDELQYVTWDFYLEQIFGKNAALTEFFEKVDTIKKSVQLQEDFELALYHTTNQDVSLLFHEIEQKKLPVKNPHVHTAVKHLDMIFSSISSTKDRLFCMDILRLCTYGHLFGDELLDHIGTMKLADFRLLNQAFCRIMKKYKQKAFNEFHELIFLPWREEHLKDFLKEKRRIEKEHKTYAKPYLDYLDKQEKKMFVEYWQANRIDTLLKWIENELEDQDCLKLKQIFASLSFDLKKEFLKTFREFEELDLPLFSKTRRIQTEKDLAKAFYPSGGFGFTRSYAFQSTAPQGSLFKLVTAYEALRQNQSFTLIDEPKGKVGAEQIVAYSINKAPYLRLYKGGRLPKSASSSVGEVDLVHAIERSSNPYFAILAGDYLSSPEDLNIAASSLGFGEKTGVSLPFEAAGYLPIDLKINKTGLYAYAIGQHTFLSTPLQAAFMLSAFANGGKSLKPQIVKEILRATDEEIVQKSQPEIKQLLPYNSKIQMALFDGMDLCVWGEKGGARPSSILSLLTNPFLMKQYQELKHQMIGKTGTAEILFNPGKFPSSTAKTYKHIWFGSICLQEAYRKNTIQDPELVVVVFSRFGNGGKTVAPLAAQMIHKWREIQRLHSEDIKSIEGSLDKTESK